MKVQIKSFLNMRHYVWADKPEFILAQWPATDFDPDVYRTNATVCEVVTEHDIPDDFDARPQMIAALEQQRRKAMADHEALMNVIEGRIASLRAIEHKVTA